MDNVLPKAIVRLLLNHGVRLNAEESRMLVDFFTTLTDLSKKIEEQNLLLKPVLNLDEACSYLRMSSSHLYKLTSQKQIPHFCPQGKKLYFRRDELDQWLQRNRKSSSGEIEAAAVEYTLRNKRSK